MRREESSMALYENTLMVMVMARWWVVSSADGSDGWDAAHATFYSDMDGSGTMLEFHIISSFFFSLLKRLELTHSYTLIFFTSWTTVSYNFIPSFHALKVRLGETNSHNPYFTFERANCMCRMGLIYHQPKPTRMHLFSKGCTHPNLIFIWLLHSPFLL